MSSREIVLGDQHVPGGPLPGDSVESHWVNLRWRRIFTWIAVTTVSVALAVAIPIRMSTEVGKPYIGASEITGGVVFLVGSVVTAVWMAWIAPRAFTRQGVAADAFGVALIQDPNLWFAGRTVRIPWGVIHSISERVSLSGGPDSRTKRKIAILDVGTKDHAVVPSWASVMPLPAFDGAPPGIRINITPGNSRQPKVVQAFREVRPDLFA